jgi:hypothetical protein
VVATVDDTQQVGSQIGRFLARQLTSRHRRHPQLLEEVELRKRMDLGVATENPGQHGRARPAVAHDEHHPGRLG